jgi:hypothetical protein
MALIPMPMAFWLIYSLVSFLNERTVSNDVALTIAKPPKLFVQFKFGN